MADNDLSEEPQKPSTNKEGKLPQNTVDSLFNLLGDEFSQFDREDANDQPADLPGTSPSSDLNSQGSSTPLNNESELKKVVHKFEEVDRRDGIQEGFHKDKLYLSMMMNFQQGEWSTGLGELLQLREKYPYEHELNYLKNEMELHARLDEVEQFETKKQKRKKIKETGFRILILLGIFALIFGVAYSYSTWFKTRFEQISEQIKAEQETLILNTNFNNAQQLLLAFRPNEALPLLMDIQTTNPDFPGLAESLDKAHSLISLEALYNEALQKKEAGDLVGALAAFQEIESKFPNYRDVSLQSKEIQRQFTLDDLIEEADNAIQSGDWEKAIQDYEQVRNRDFSYQTQIVEQRLYYSYLNAAQKLLEDQPDSLEALTKAQGYYSKALSLKPQDTTAIEELEAARTTIGNRLYTKYIDLAQQSLIGQPDSIEGLKKAEEYLAMASTIRPSDVLIAQERYNAEQYLAAQADFQKKNWNSAITTLQAIYEFSPNYAGGTARQTLYDAYILRGDYYKTSGSAKAALEDYQKALSIAEVTPENQIRLFEAQTKIGDILGIMNNYDLAIYQYRAAMDSANINQILLTNLELVNTINQADEYTRRNMYQAAYNLYHELMKQITEQFKTVSHVIESGDYLTQLANLYKTTASAILAANNLSDPSELSIGERIIIPVLP